MKRILLLLLFIYTGFLLRAQVYNNEWIDYSKTYYKFRVGTTGLYRITQATLSSIGLGNTPAENFQLWRNGKEISRHDRHRRSERRERSHRGGLFVDSADSDASIPGLYCRPHNLRRRRGEGSRARLREAAGPADPADVTGAGGLPPDPLRPERPALRVLQIPVDV